VTGISVTAAPRKGEGQERGGFGFQGSVPIRQKPRHSRGGPFAEQSISLVGAGLLREAAGLRTGFGRSGCGAFRSPGESVRISQGGRGEPRFPLGPAGVPVSPAPRHTRRSGRARGFLLRRCVDGRSRRRRLPETDHTSSSAGWSLPRVRPRRKG